MALAPLNSLLSLVTQFAPGCPDYTCTLNLRLAAIELCERTRCWRSLETVSHTAGDPAITIPAYATLHAIEHADLDGERLEPVAFTDMPANPADLGTIPRYITQHEPNVLSVMPDADGTLTVAMFLKPTMGDEWQITGGEMVNSYDQVPEFIISQHGETIAEGALARIFAQPAMPWYDPGLATYFRQRFDDRAVSMVSSSVRGQQRAPVRTKTLWF